MNGLLQPVQQEGTGDLVARLKKLLEGTGYGGSLSDFLRSMMQEDPARRGNTQSAAMRSSIYDMGSNPGGGGLHSVPVEDPGA